MLQILTSLRTCLPLSAYPACSVRYFKDGSVAPCMGVEYPELIRQVAATAEMNRLLQAGRFDVLHNNAAVFL